MLLDVCIPIYVIGKYNIPYVTRGTVHFTHHVTGHF